MASTVWKVLTRRKILDPVTTEQTQLRRVLNTFDLTALGVGSTLGVGVYVLAGHVAKDTAGPAVVLSFLIAAIASVFAGLCYAEFGARAPRAGSAYIYSYVCVGEFVAFVIGWNLILEYVIGSASVARGLSLYLDTLINNTLQKTFEEIAPINVDFMAQYFDFFSFGISIFLSIALAFGMKESSWTNNIFTLLNLGVVLFVIIAGSIKADPANWDLSPPANKTIHAGTGGFFPFGIEGMIKGAATCFYGFVGFDCIATTGEEVKNPKKAIPISIIVSLLIIFLAYFGTSTVVTLMVPYYLQDPNAPIPHAFEAIGWEIPKWIVAIGGIFGLCASLFGAMFPLPRIIYAMASDGLVFRFLGKVHQRFKTPVVGTLLAGILTGLMSALFDLKQLVNMMSIGTLMAYTIVAASVLLLRICLGRLAYLFLCMATWQVDVNSYQFDKDNAYQPLPASSDSEDSDIYVESRSFDRDEQPSDDIQLLREERVTCGAVFRQLYNCGRQQDPTKVSERIVSLQIYIYCILCILIGLCAMYLGTSISKGEIWAIVLTSVVVLFAVLVVMSIATQPKSKKELSFKVPFVPLIPALSILINVYLMLMLDSHTWIRFAVWMVIGVPTYYFSVKNHYDDARNMSISSSKTNHSCNVIMGNGKLGNGFTNNGFQDSENRDGDEIIENKTQEVGLSAEKIESTIRMLDDVLEKEEDRASLIGERGNSMTDTISENSLVPSSIRENVVAVVHCDNVVTPPVQRFSSTPVPSFSKSSSADSAHVVSTNGDLPHETPPTTETPLGRAAPSDIDISSDVDQIEIAPDADASRNGGLTTPPEVQDSFENNSENLESKIFDSDLNSTKPVTPNTSETDDFVPPPPPPMWLDYFQDADVDTPRPQYTVHSLSQVKLRKTKRKAPNTPEQPPTPPPDYSRQNSENTLEKSYYDDDGNLKFGSPKYKEFRDKLSRNFEKPIFPKTYGINVNPARTSTLEHPPNEDVVQEGISPSAAKGKLLSHLEQPGTGLTYAPSLREPKVKKHLTIDNDDDQNTVIENSDLDGYREQHKRNMNNVFGSIKLRKEDSFSAQDNSGSSQRGNSSAINDVRDKDDAVSFQNSDLNDYRELHKQGMRNIFGSIKLRKEDSFGANDQNPVQLINSGSSATGMDSEKNTLRTGDEHRMAVSDESEGDTGFESNDGINQHKNNMNSVLRSIRSRKVDSFTNSEEQNLA